MSEKSNALLQVRIEQLRMQIQSKRDPQQIANCTGCEFTEEPSGKYFELFLFEKNIHLSYPELVATDFQGKTELPISSQAMICYHLLTADGSPMEDRWISFAELPDGRFYQKAFQGYSGDELASYFGNDVNLFKKVNQLLQGESLSVGDAGFRYMALPKVPLAVIYFMGDDEFPSTCKLLFDASARHYLPTDACAILGSMLTHRILQCVKTGEERS
jgi:hypothetical protein